MDSTSLDEIVHSAVWLRIPWAYSIAMLLSVAIFFLVAKLVPMPRARTGLSPFEKWSLIGAAFIGGTLGGKLPFVLAQKSWWSLEPWFMDGKTITTGLVGAYVSVEVAKAIQGIRVKTGDGFALPLAAALAVGRWGCFFNGCCYGAVCSFPWGVTFAGIDGVRHPTQIYEAIFHSACFGLLWFIRKKGLWKTHQLQLYLVTYCLFRFLTEWIRPEPEVLWRLTFYQWTVLGFAGLLMTQWLCEVPRQSSLVTGQRDIEPEE